MDIQNKDRMSRLLAKLEALNSQDPNQELADGIAWPRELIYAKRLAAWVQRLEPNASEELLIASHGQHVCRWTIPRNRYEMNRKGYLRWREDLKTFHADTVARLMQEEGYPQKTIDHLRQIIRKRDFQDPVTQCVEDALCLVFLETQFSDLRNKTPDDKMADILRKTWRKMSERGKQAALALTLPVADKDFILMQLPNQPPPQIKATDEAQMRQEL